MRSYPRNSPQAAARIVALTLLADGHVCSSELQALQRHHAGPRLGLLASELQQVLRELCEDLLAAGSLAWGGSGLIDRSTLHALLDEVSDPPLRRQVVALCLAVVQSDTHLADGESSVIEAAVERWRLHAQALQPA